MVWFLTFLLLAFLVEGCFFLEKHVLPRLPYAYNALEPYIDEKTMSIHHSKHHQAYVDKLNAAIEKHPELSKKPLPDLLKNLNSVPEDIRTAVRNHGGGHFNHSLFWEMMAPKSGGEPKGEIAAAIKKEFVSFESFKQKFSDTAAAHFGSGWGWLAVNSEGKMLVYSTPNQDSPIMQNHSPLLGIDVWEHSFYLLYQNRKPEYIQNWWNVINWKKVEELFRKTK